MSMTTPDPSAYRWLDIASAMAQIGDSEALLEMLPMVQETLARDVPAIEAFLVSGDVPSANHLLHPLKGFMPIFCTPALRDAVAAVEKLSKSEPANVVLQEYIALKPQLLAFEAEVLAYLASAR